MGWGVRTITIVDSSRVSFSNPVRELLFELNGRKPKAACAAELLKRFFLRVNATKRSLSVPIPDRPISRASVAQANADVAALEALFDTLDAIFLLMESCESRWLLTALGFDMFAVMCCGAHSTEAKGERLSGYYCDDIVTPADALQLFSTDRTVERMYTVTMSGLAATAFATAVELLVSLLKWGSTPHSATTDTGRRVCAHVGGCARGDTAPAARAVAQLRNMHITGAALDNILSLSCRQGTLMSTLPLQFMAVH